MPIEDNWPFQRIQPEDSQPVDDIIDAIEAELDRLDSDIDAIKQQRFADSATGDDLERLGEEVGIERQTGESEDHYRFRVLIRKAAGNSRGTLRNIEAILQHLFGDDVQSMSVDTPSSEPVVLLRIPDTVIGDVPLTQSELTDELSTLLPAGDRLEVITGDTWQLNQSGSSGIGQGELI